MRIKPKLFVILFSINIVVSIKQLITEMSIDDKMPNGLSNWLSNCYSILSKANRLTLPKTLLQ